MKRLNNVVKPESTIPDVLVVLKENFILLYSNLNIIIMDPGILLRNLNDAINKHDIETFLKYFSGNYSSEQPMHPDRMFQGIEQVRKNWKSIFLEMDDFRSTILRCVSDANTVWVEWLWQGTRQDQSKLEMCGVCIFQVEKNEIQWGRLYIEPVQYQGAGIDAAVKEVMQGKEN